MFWELLPGTTGKEILELGSKQLSETYPHVVQIENEKVTSVTPSDAGLLSNQ